jgi:hypothetical protein
MTLVTCLKKVIGKLDFHTQQKYPSTLKAAFSDKHNLRSVVISRFVSKEIVIILFEQNDLLLNTG